MLERFGVVGDVPEYFSSGKCSKNGVVKSYRKKIHVVLKFLQLEFSSCESLVTKQYRPMEDISIYTKVQ